MSGVHEAQPSLPPFPHLPEPSLQVGVSCLILMRINMKIMSGLDMFPTCQYHRFGQVWEPSPNYG